MIRNQRCDPCPGCGEIILTRDELPFIVRKSWRRRVADTLGYERDFITNLGEKTRIHLCHFQKGAVVNGKPVGLPTLNITKISHWPTNAAVNDIIENNKVDDVLFENDENIDVLNNTFEEEDDEAEIPSSNHYHLTELSQQKLLFRHCYFCGDIVDDKTLKMVSRGGILFVKYWCRLCRRRRCWRSSNNFISPKVTAATMLSGNLIARIVSFFSILQCSFPSTRHLFRCAQTIVRPGIDVYYNNHIKSIIQKLVNRNSPLHLSMDSQFDSPGHTAFYCTVSAVESLSKKIISFATVAKNEVKNRSCNPEREGFCRVLNDLLQIPVSIQSVTTDNSPTLNKLFRERYSDIEHFIDLWHVLRNMFKKFVPKFKLPNYAPLQNVFMRITKYIWIIGSEEKKHEMDVVEKCLATLFHVTGLHEWPQGKFVNISKTYLNFTNFPNGEICNIVMQNHLCCAHEQLDLEKNIDPQSPTFQALVDDLCSNNRIKQLKRISTTTTTSAVESYHSVSIMHKPKRYLLWYINIRNKLAILHHNKNIDYEMACKQEVLRESDRITRVNRLPSKRIYKTILLKWQLEIMESLQNVVPIDDFEDVVNEFVDLEFDEINEEDLENDAALNEQWLGFFQNHIKL